MIVIIVTAIAVWAIKLNFGNHPTGETDNPTENKVEVKDQEVIHKIKEEMNATADADMYQIEEEYDGRQILQIKPSIQFETVLAGILKNGKPSENEIQDLLKSKPIGKGIWIAKQSRGSFLNLLKDNGINGFAIREDGFLYETEGSDKEEAKKLKDAIQSNGLCMVDISGTSYTRDDFSGEIVEYPFEKMDPHQAVDVYQEGDTVILEVTTNEKEILTKQEILEDILLNLKK